MGIASETKAVVERWQQSCRRLEVDGASTSVFEAGRGDPVVCLHGVPSSAFLYRKVVPELAAQNLRALAFDFPGLGLADRPIDFDYSWSGLAAWSVRACDALGLDRFHLVVHDIGGPIGFEVVRRIPDRIRSLTVLNTLVKLTSFSRPWTMAPFAVPGVGNVWLALIGGFLFEQLFRLQGIASKVPSPEVRAYLELLKRGDGGAAFLKIMRGFELTASFEQGIVRALSERKFPAQVVWGEDDGELTVTREAEDIRATLGVDTIHRLPGKHFVQEDSPKEIAALIAKQAVS